jgi:16S rRNA (cytosine967-C5)-methyltransferase
MVNAVLRKAAVAPLSEDPHHVLPSWLADRWCDHGEWIARIREPASINIAGQLPDELELRPATLDGKTIDSLWTLPPGGGNVTELPGFSEGLFWVMDPAAAKVADMVIASVGGKGTVLDACAAPGGKSCRLAREGLKVTAIDRDPDRLDQMAENLHRLNIDVSLNVHDWVSGPMDPKTTFDAVLVDAPCTGLGIVRRHPEIIWRRQPGDMAAMAITQRIILRHASTHVKPGGALIYAVCSTEKEEGGDVAASLAGWQIEEAWASAPPSGDEDGFQAFVLRRDRD